MKLASMIRTLDKPRSFRRHSASNSRDSSAALTQVFGGWSHRYWDVSKVYDLGVFLNEPRNHDRNEELIHVEYLG